MSLQHNLAIAPISEADYLAQEQYSLVKHEYVDGYIYAMSGAKAAHNRISGNIYAAIHAHLRGTPCQSYASDMKIKIGSRFYYPDVMVDCGHVDDDSVYTETAVLIIEVLSKSTRKNDRQSKRLAYLQLDTLQEYVLIEQDFVDVEVQRRSNGWQSEHYFLGEELTLSSIGLTVAVADIYERVQNEDMQEWLAR